MRRKYDEALAAVMSDVGNDDDDNDDIVPNGSGGPPPSVGSAEQTV